MGSRKIARRRFQEYEENVDGFRQGRKGPEAGTETNKLLIHCLHGKTRSAAVAARLRAVILQEKFAVAYERVQKVRDVFVPEEWHTGLQQAVEEVIKERNRMEKKG